MYTQTQRLRSRSKQIFYRLQIWSFLLFLPLVFMAALFTTQQVYGQNDNNFSCDNGSGKLKSEECEALVSFYQTHGGPNWITSTTNTNWLTSNSTPCTWVGITCEGNDELHVTQLILNGRGLTGTLATGLENFSMLHTLNVSDNRLEGVIPPSLVNAKELNRLYLQNNLFIGTFPTIQPTKTFTVLGLGEINIGGSLSQLLTRLPKTLTYLHLRNTNLTGNIPDQITEFSQLEELYLDKNFLSGEISLVLGTISTIKRLDLSYNQLSGTIPETVACNPNMVDLSDNYLRVSTGYLNLGHNKLITGTTRAKECLGTRIK